MLKFKDGTILKPLMERGKALEWFLAYLRKKKRQTSFKRGFFLEAGKQNQILGLRVTNKFTFILKTFSHHPIKSSG